MDEFLQTVALDEYINESFARQASCFLQLLYDIGQVICTLQIGGSHTKLYTPRTAA